MLFFFFVRQGVDIFSPNPKTGESLHIGRPDIRSYRPYLVAVPSIRNPETRCALIKWGLLIMITTGMKIIWIVLN